MLRGEKREPRPAGSFQDTISGMAGFGGFPQDDGSVLRGEELFFRDGRFFPGRRNFGIDKGGQAYYNPFCVLGRKIAGCGSVWLEHLLWEQGVASSNLVTPITII